MRNISNSFSRDNSSDSSHSRSSMERKRSLRSCLVKTKAIHELGPDAVNSLEEIIQETDAINLETINDETTFCQDEIFMDSEIMVVSSKMLSSVSSSIAKKLIPYSYQDLAEKLLNYVSGLSDSSIEELDWSCLEKEALELTRPTVNYTPLLGCLEPLEKRTIARREATKRDANAPTRRPQAIVDVTKDEDSVEQTVKMIKRLISDHYKMTAKPIDYFRLVLNPNSYSKTIENMLHVSFLIRDGVIKMLADDEERLHILPNSKEIRAASQKKTETNIQSVFSLSMQQWKILVAGYRIELPMINFE